MPQMYIFGIGLEGMVLYARRARDDRYFPAKKSMLLVIFDGHVGVVMRINYKSRTISSPYIAFYITKHLTAR